MQNQQPQNFSARPPYRPPQMAGMAPRMPQMAPPGGYQRPVIQKSTEPVIQPRCGYTIAIFVIILMLPCFVLALIERQYTYIYVILGWLIFEILILADKNLTMDPKQKRSEVSSPSCDKVL